MLSTRHGPTYPAVVLPQYMKRHWRIAFWLTISLGAGVVVAALLWEMMPLRRIAIGLGVADLLALPGVLRPSLVVLPMRAWNRLARYYARAAALWISAICFYVILWPLGRLGYGMRLAPPKEGETLWTAWSSAQSLPAACPPGIVAADERTGWVGDFAAWARQRGNRWRWALLPFLLVLSALDAPADADAPPEGIYTLY